MTAALAFVTTQESVLAPTYSSVDGEFGFGIDIDGSCAIVGAFKNNSAGAVYIYELVESSAGGALQWGEVARFDGATTEHFGHSVGITCAGGWAVVGAWQYNDDRGRIYFLRRFDGVSKAWVKLPAVSSPVSGGSRFGFEVAIPGTLAAIGAYWYPGTTTGNDAKGIVALYELADGQWTFKRTLSDPAGVIGDELGYDVDVTDGIVVAGARHYSAGNEGRMHVFERDGGGAWGHVAFGAPTPEIRDNFGLAVAVSGGYLAASSLESSKPGQVHLFRRVG